MLARMGQPTLTEEKAQIANAFNQIASKYDIICSAEPHYFRHMSMSATRMAVPRNGHILDVCAGTGLSTQVLIDVYPEADITGIDASQGMLEVARAKPQLARARFVHGDGSDPRSAGCEGPYDGIFLAYGIRNLPDPDACLKNLFNLLKPGGKICFHEYSVRHSFTSRMKWHLHWLRILFPASVRTDTVKPHWYLWRSVNDFQGVPAFCQRLEQHGFTQVKVEPMDGDVLGVLHTFTGTRP